MLCGWLLSTARHIVAIPVAPLLSHCQRLAEPVGASMNRGRLLCGRLRRITAQQMLEQVSEHPGDSSQFLMIIDSR
jgi:hypothetical protein